MFVVVFAASSLFRLKRFVEIFFVEYFTLKMGAYRKTVYNFDQEPDIPGYIGTFIKGYSPKSLKASCLWGKNNLLLKLGYREK